VSVIVGAKQFWVANTGDSRAVLVENDGRAATLTVDHSPGSKKEGARIRRVGLADLTGLPAFTEAADWVH